MEDLDAKKIFIIVAIFLVIALLSIISTIFKLANVRKYNAVEIQNVNTNNLVYSIASTSSDDEESEVQESAEATSFNSKFENYQGSQTGKNINNLIEDLISNARDNKNDLEKVPTVTFVDENEGKLNAKISTAGDYSSYVSNCNKIIKLIESDHSYEITFEKDTNGFITKININF